MSLQPGSYVCVQTGGLLAWLIRKATRSAYNHAFVEARPEGVRNGLLSSYAGVPAVANTGEQVTDTQRAAVVASAENFAGVPYNWPDLVAIGLGDLGWHWRFLLRAVRADRLLICSQLVSLAGKAAGLDWLCGRSDASQVTPADLARRPGVAPVTIQAGD
jgi:uncharacterized protein YycO